MNIASILAEAVQSAVDRCPLRGCYPDISAFVNSQVGGTEVGDSLYCVSAITWRSAHEIAEAQSSTFLDYSRPVLWVQFRLVMGPGVAGLVEVAVQPKDPPLFEGDDDGAARC